MNILHLVGAPGCGKTWAILNKIAALLDRGLAPDRVAFCSFTKAAIHAAKGRIEEQTGTRASDLTYFGTLHSMAYRHLQLTRNAVVSGKWWGEFCQGHAIPHSDPEGGVDDDLMEPLGTEEGDTLRRFHDWHRNCRIPLESALRQFDPGPCDTWSRGRQAWFSETFEQEKTAAGKWDFTDMLLELARSGWVPDASVLVIDEAQDLSPLQREIALTWAGRIGHVLLGYDVDQTIFDFQGADPAWLLQLDGQREFLERSFRVPRAPAALCHRIIRRNRNRYRNDWEPRGEQGAVRFGADAGALVKDAADPDGGSWYFLARNRHYLTAYTDLLRERGIPYVNLRGHTPRVGGGTRAAFHLAAGRSVSLAGLDDLANQTTARDWWVHGAKARLKREAASEPNRPVLLADLPGLGALPVLCEQLADPKGCLKPLKGSDDGKRYYGRLVGRYGLDGLDMKPWVTVSTMHGVKGGEADNVVLHPMMTRRTAEGYEADPEPERRVWYVGASRTRSNLYLLDEDGRGSSFEDW